jgi:predicted ATPase/DNA-binding winged helix-turn-helix (wHTH) protein
VAVVNALIRFGAFRLLPAQRQLLRDGAPVPLGARAMDLLLHLTANPGTVVTKQALMKAVWPDRIVEENNLTVNMTALRRALGEQTDGQPMIQTVTGRGYVFVAALLTDTPDRPASPSATGSPTIPSLASRLIGREPALAELNRLMRVRRIVSIVGPGGVGKTVLAVHLADSLASEFSGGVGFVDLSNVSDPKRVSEAVAAVLAGGGAGSNTATDRLTTLLRDQKFLLVLDNCEHMDEPVAHLVNAIAATCPGVAMLVTSREGLFVQGEQIFRLQPLPVPDDPNLVTAETALQYGAVALFVERAKAVGDFVLDDSNAAVVATICARLDGIPLAIEMAASRLKVLSPAQLAERLVERFRLLGAAGRGTTPRHRTLQAMIDWSYDFLPPEERALLRCLSVFSGGASLAAIQAVAGDGNGEAETDDVDLLDRLTALADKSMVTLDATGDGAASPRFRLLETVRQYAVRKAVEAGEISLPQRHAQYFADLFAEAAHAWPTMRGRDWLTLYAPDAENLRSALAWSFGPDGNASIGMRLTASTVPLWWELPETPVAEGQRWLDVAAARLVQTTPPSIRGWLRFGQSWRDFRFGDRENVQPALDSAALFRTAGDAAGLGASLWRAGSASLTSETADQAETFLVEAEQVLRGMAPGKWLALTLIRLGDLRFRQARAAPALANYQEGFSLSRSTDFWIGLVNGGSNMAELMFSTGNTERALRQLESLRDELPPSRRTPLMATLSAHLLLAGRIEAMRQTASEAIVQGVAIGLTAAVAWTVETVALLAAMEGNIDAAARLAGYARSVHPSIATRAGSRKAVVERLNMTLQKGLSAESLDLALAEGGRWSLPMAAEYARSVISNN